MNPFTTDNWQGRIDAEEGERGQRWHQQVCADDGTQPLVLLGFACDAGVARNQGRIGAAASPPLLRRALAGLPTLPERTLADAGDVVCSGDGDLEAAQARFGDAVCTRLKAGKTVIGLGGGHEIAYASFSGVRDFVAAQDIPPRIGIINLDAHLDIRIDHRPSSGTPFRQMAEDCAARGWEFHYACIGVSRYANTVSLFDRADELGVAWLEDRDCHLGNRASMAKFVTDFIVNKDVIYLTLDLDVLPAATMPAVSAPAAYGVDVAVIDWLLREIIASGKVRMMDVAEYNPRFDIDTHGARVAARLLATAIEALFEVSR